MANPQSDKFRANAAECRSNSDVTFSGTEKNQWLQLARQWDEMADFADQRMPQFESGGGKGLGSA